MLGNAAFTVLVGLAVALLTLNVVAWSGTFADAEERAAVATTDAALRAAKTKDTAATLVERQEQAAPAKVVLTARRGPCWLSIRRGSPTGTRLYLGILARGRSLKVSGPRIWMHVGAGENLVVTVNGRRLADVPDGISELAVTADGIRRV